MALQTIKAVARRRWPEGTQRRFSWYEPLSDEGAIARAVRLVLGRPGLFLNTTSDARLDQSSASSPADMAPNATPTGTKLLHKASALPRSASRALWKIRTGAATTIAR